MTLVLEKVTIKRGSLTLEAHGTFDEGIHLVSGRVGSGKTTLALVMAGLLPPSSGRVVLRDFASCMLSLQFPEYQITGLTIAEECASWGIDPKKVMAFAGLGQEIGTNPLRLSRGELKRFHLACVLLKKYDLLLLDEPFGALDCRQKELLCSRLSRHPSGITVIFTHEQEFLPRIDYRWEIIDGELIHLKKPLLKNGDLPRSINSDGLPEAG
jgi:energy-coupling factor transport system ATP-binding protein